MDVNGNISFAQTTNAQSLIVGNLSNTTYGKVVMGRNSYFVAGATTGITFNDSTDTKNLFIISNGAPNGAMTLDSSGKLLVGTTSIPFSASNTGVISWSVATASGGEGGFVFQNTNTSTSSDPNPVLVISKGSSTYTSSQRFVQFNANGTGQQPMGGIVGNGATNVQFISLSDVREKENIEPITGSLNKVVALNPVEFDWKKTGEHITAGFIAQEVESLFPEYVVDNVANAGEEERKGLTGGMSAGFIAHLVKAIQEQQALITTLTDRITALEAK
jgi:hypothetical protein